MDETLTTIKETLTTILSNQESGITFAERRAIAEERKADAFEFIAHHIGKLTGNLYSPKHQPDVDRPEPQGEGEIMEARTSRPVIQDDMDDDNTSDMTKDDILELIITMRNDGSTYNEIATHLVDLNLPTFSGRGKWHAQTIHRLCQTA